MHKEEMEKWEKMDSTEWHGHHPWPMPPHHWGNNHVKPSNLSTNWLIVDLGFTNYNDKTNYQVPPRRHLHREVIQTGST